MKFIQLAIAATLICGLTTSTLAQDVPEAPMEQEEEKASIFQLVEVPPIHKDCDGTESRTCTEKKILEHVFGQVRYPEAAKNDGIQGTVYIKFTIDKSGKVNNIQTIRGVHPELDAEGEKAVSSLPYFTPGMQNGKPVNVEYTLPIKFVLSGAKKATKQTDQVEEKSIKKKKKRRKSKD